MRSSKFTNAIDFIRQEYIDGAKISDLAEKYKVSIHSIYSRRRNEQWDLLRDKRLVELANSRRIMLTSLKCESLKFYNEVLSKCSNLLKQQTNPKALKILVETRIMAENQMLLYSGEILEKATNEEKEEAGILVQLSKL